MIDKLEAKELEKIEWKPAKNANIISIVKRKDGNYRGFMQKNGKLLQVRQGDPNTVLQLLLTTD